MVRWTYRLLLGREPENEAAIAGWCATGDLLAVRDGMLLSSEMAALAASDFPERGSWADGPLTEEAAIACLALCDGTAPDASAVEALRLRHPSLRALRRHLLGSPEIERRLPRGDGPRSRGLRLPGREYTLHGDSREPDFLTAPGIAPRLAALLRAIWPDGGEGRVMVEAGAGIGVSTLGLAAGAPGAATLIAHEASLRRAASLAENLAGAALPHVSARAIRMGPVTEMMAREQLPRLDLLRLNEPATSDGHPNAQGRNAQGPNAPGFNAPGSSGAGSSGAGSSAARLVMDMAPWLLERRTLTLMRFDMAEILTEPGPGPREILLSCQRIFPHVVAFDATHRPHVLADEVALNAALHRTLMRPDRRDEFLMCAELNWLERY